MLFLGLPTSYAQTHTITGTVINGVTGKPIPGVAVEIKGGTEIVKSSSNGNYSITIPDTIKTITFANFAGMDILEIKNIGSDVIDIYLSEFDVYDLSLEELMKIKVSTAGKQEQQISDIPASVVVITRKEIELFGYSSLKDILKNIPGYYSFNNLGVDILGIRGFCKEKGTNFVILVNGIKITDQKILKFYGIPVEAIDRIEVVRGPLAVIYGNNAFFGAINIITNTDILNSASLSYGSLDTKQLNGRASVEKSGLKFATNISVFKSDGRDIPLAKMMQNPERMDQPLFGGPSGNGLGLPLSAQHTKGYLGKSQRYFDISASIQGFSLNAFYSESQNGWYYYYPSIDEGSQFKNKNFSLMSEYKKTISEQFSFETKLRYSEFSSYNEYHHLFEGFYGWEMDNFNEIEAEVNLFWTPNKKINFISGFQYENMFKAFNQQDVPIAKIVNMSQYYIDKGDNGIVYSGFLQIEYKPFNNFKFIAGARLEKAMSYHLRINNYEGETPPDTNIIANIYDEKGKGELEIMPRFAAIYNINDNHIIKFLYGKAIKRPDYSIILEDMSDIARGEKPSGYSKSEYIQTAELNYNAVLTENFGFNTSIFFNILQNLLVERNEIVNNILRAWWDNAGIMETKGIEASLMIGNKKKFYCEVSAVYQKSIDKTVDIDASYSPDFLAYLKISYQMNKQLSFSILGNYVDKIYPYFNYTPIFDQNGNSTGEYIGRTASDARSYFTMDANVHYKPKFLKGLYVNINCSNLLNAEYFYPSFSINSAWADRGTLGFERTFNFTAGIKF